MNSCIVFWQTSIHCTVRSRVRACTCGCMYASVLATHPSVRPLHFFTRHGASGQSHPEIVSVGANDVGSNFSAPDVFFFPVALTTASTPEAAGIPAGSTPRSPGSWDAADDGVTAAVVVVLTGFVESVFGVFFASFFLRVLVSKNDSDQEEGGGGKR
jgi:hypothetical protein